MNTLKLVLRNLLWMNLLLISAGSQADENWGIDQLMQSLATNQSSHAKFIEIKSIAILKEPVESSGELFYQAPDRLEKRTLAPKAESMLLEKDKLTIEQRGKKHVLRLQNYPEVAAFIDSIRGTLAGDRTALERSYQLTIEGNEQHWDLTLLPIAEKMKKIIEKISIVGSGNALETINILQADGDSSQMTITPLPVAD